MKPEDKMKIDELFAKMTFKQLEEKLIEAGMVLGEEMVKEWEW